MQAIIVADDPKRFAQEVIKLLKNRNWRQTVAQKARELVEKKYGWPSIVKRVDAVYESILA